jgi:ketosteroid isomerase-like protein
MIDTAPSVVTRYLAAADTSDIPALADCFTADGTVLDEGRTYRGRAEIIGWRKALAGTWTYTSATTGSDRISAKEYRVSVHIEGDFPGGVADLTYRFTLQDGLIDELSIRA